MLPPIQVRMLKECLKCGGGGVQRKKRSATPRSTHFSALLYKSEQWSAELGSDYFTHTHTHKGGVLAPQETLQARIATTKTFVSVDYPHCQVRTIFFSILDNNKRFRGGGKQVKIY